MAILRGRESQMKMGWIFLSIWQICSLNTNDEKINSTTKYSCERDNCKYLSTNSLFQDSKYLFAENSIFIAQIGIAEFEYFTLTLKFRD